MELMLRDAKKTITVSESIFNFSFNKALLHQVITAYSASARQGTHAQKNCAAVSGSGKKPWRQKGTGRARSGSVKSPIWRSGGVTFAAKKQDYSQKINRKMYRGALKIIFSELVRKNRLIVFEEFSIEAPKTKILVQKLKKMSLENVLIITNGLEKNLSLSSRNLYKVNVRNVTNIDPVSLIVCKKVIITANAVKKIEEMLS